jgi:hypothetical protein
MLSDGSHVPLVDFPKETMHKNGWFSMRCGEKEVLNPSWVFPWVFP